MLLINLWISLLVATSFLSMNFEPFGVSYKAWDSWYWSGILSVWVDWMSVTLVLVVALITYMVIWFSFSYMSSEWAYTRFLSVLSLFVLSMWSLSLSSSWVLLFISWEVLGFSSYFLVWYFKSMLASSGSYMTAMMNRVGDFALLCCLFLSIGEGMSGFSYPLFYSSMGFSYSLGFILLVSVCSKSAQFPFCAWLPAAMAAPTPVSALVHSSTLVAAGVYLGLRSISLISFSSLMGLMVLASWSLVLSTLSAFFTMDGKKVIALSTLSQISVVGISLSLAQVELAFFHLCMHAFTKAYLFMIMGLIMHSKSSAQDFRSLSAGFSQTWAAYHLVGACGALVAFPFLSLFYSKEVLVFWAASMGSFLSASLVLMLGACGTILYSSRILSWVLSNFQKKLALSLKDFKLTVVFAILMTMGYSLGYLSTSKIKEPSLVPWCTGSILLLGLLLGASILLLVFPLWGSSVDCSPFGSGFYLFSTSGELFLFMNSFSSKILKDLDQGYFEASLPGLTSVFTSSLSGLINSFNPPWKVFLFSSFSLGLMVLTYF